MKSKYKCATCGRPISMKKGEMIVFRRWPTPATFHIFSECHDQLPQDVIAQFIDSKGSVGRA